MGDLLGLVVSLAAGFTLVLQAHEELLVLPADGLGEVTQAAGLAAGAHLEGGQGLGQDLTLHLVEGVGDTLENGEALQGGGTTLGLVCHHAADDPPHHAGGSAEVVGTLGGVGQGALLEVVAQAQLVAEQGARDGDLLGADQDDLLTVLDLLGHHRGQAAHHVVTAIDNNNLQYAKKGM